MRTSFEATNRYRRPTLNGSETYGDRSRKPTSDEQVAWRHPERPCQLLDDQDRGIARAAFDVADVGAMNAGLVRERLLAPALRLAKPSQV